MIFKIIIGRYSRSLLNYLVCRIILDRHDRISVVCALYSKNPTNLILLKNMCKSISTRVVLGKCELNKPPVEIPHIVLDGIFKNKWFLAILKMSSKLSDSKNHIRTYTLKVGKIGFRGVFSDFLCM